jgi:hypothetical protein
MVPSIKDFRHKCSQVGLVWRIGVSLIHAASPGSRYHSQCTSTSGCVINTFLTFKARWTRLLPLLMFCMLQCWVGLSSSSEFLNFHTLFAEQPILCGLQYSVLNNSLLFEACCRRHR